MPSDVTDDMLENVIDDFVSNKVYDQGPKGSTCHQKAKKTQVHGYHGKKKSTGDNIWLYSFWIGYNKPQNCQNMAIR